MNSTRLRLLTAMVFAVSGLTLAQFDRLPFAPAPRGRRTVNTYQRDLGRNRYTGAKLREIRKSGQAHECARRLSAAVA